MSYSCFFSVIVRSYSHYVLMRLIFIEFALHVKQRKETYIHFFSCAIHQLPSRALSHLHRLISVTPPRHRRCFVLFVSQLGQKITARYPSSTKLLLSISVRLSVSSFPRHVCPPLFPFSVPSFFRNPLRLLHVSFVSPSFYICYPSLPSSSPSYSSLPSLPANKQSFGRL